jgi:hypothetical protein
MGCLVVRAPCSNSVTDMAAAEFDLRVVAHRRKLEERDALMEVKLVSGGES